MAKRKNMIVLDKTISHVERWRKMPTKNERRRRFYLIAAIVIASALALLAVIEGVGSIYATIVRSGGAGEVTVEKIYTEKDAVNILVLKTDDGNLELTNAVLVRFDPARGAVVCIPFSPQTVIGGRTLESSYLLGGGAQCALEFERLLGLDTVSYCTMNYSSVRDLVSAFNGVVLDIPCDIDYRSDRTDRNVVVAAGKRRFQGGEAARLLDCPEWPNGIMQQTLMHAELLCALINENLTPDTASKLDTYYSRANACMTSSSVSLAVFQSHAASFIRIARLNESQDACVVYEPQYVISGNQYELSALTLEELSDMLAPAPSQQ